MSDTNNLLLLGVGILIGLAFTTVMILVTNRSYVPYVEQPSYVSMPKSLYAPRGERN